MKETVMKRNAVELFVRPRTAQADSPVVVAVIAADATVMAAAITALGAVAVAAIAAVAAVAVAVLGGGGEEEEGERAEVGPGEGGQSRTKTVRGFKSPKVHGYVNRDLTMSASSLPVASGNREVRANADYRFDGQILRFPPNTRQFDLRDGLTFRYTITNIKEAGDAQLNFEIEELRVSTVDIPGTNGFSKVKFRAVQDDKVLWQWSAEVNQGKSPLVDDPTGDSKAIVRSEDDLLLIRNLRAPIDYRAPGADNSTVVDIVMTVEGQGARL